MVLRKRLTITGSTLRPRPVAFKGAIARNLQTHVWPWLVSGQIKPVIHSVFDACEAAQGLPSGAAQAHALMESNQHIGKIVLTWKPA
jgi:NADPH2:quinone reductase